MVANSQSSPLAQSESKDLSCLVQHQGMMGGSGHSHGTQSTSHFGLRKGLDTLGAKGCRGGAGAGCRCCCGRPI